MGRESLEAAVVRIRTVEKNVVGAGFLVGKRQVLTCAHVIAQALGLAENLEEPPLGCIVMDFPLLAPHMRLAAKVVFWSPVQQEVGGDIAGLELLGDPPEGAAPVQFSPARDVWGHPFHTFGFPVGQDDGVYATGQLLGRQASNWLLLEDVKTEGFAITPGFSGGPVWDTQLQGVVGMVVAAVQRTETKTAFVIPFDVLATAWQCLQPVAHQRVFLSSAPGDKAFAERLAASLRAANIVVWDEEHGPPDASPDVQERLKQSIRDAQAMLLVASPQARTSYTVKEHLHLADLYQRRLILTWIGDGASGQSPLVSWPDTLWIDAQHTSYETTFKRIEGALQQNRARTTLLETVVEEQAPQPRNPYKGLHPFTANDVGDFFGRERLIHDLEHDLAALLTTTENERCLTILGPSGSGKSSVVMAGLIPRLQQGALPGSERWIYLKPMTPGRHPLDALARSLNAQLPDSSFEAVRGDLDDDATQGLHRLASELAKEQGCRVVLLVDQFEELFSQTEHEAERRRFLDQLLTAVTTPIGPLLVLLTLRADFYDRPMQYPKLSNLVQAHQRQVLPMEVEDLRATVERPAALLDVQLSFEGHLVGDLLFEVQGHIGALPLLQFTLDQLFKRRDGRRLTLYAYHEIGGIRGALSHHAEETYTQLPSEKHRGMTRTLFLRLVEPGTDQQGTTRRRAALSEFTFEDSEQTRLMRETIDAFVKARLLTASEVEGTTTVEVSHEAVLREWPRLAGWLCEARTDIEFQQSLSANVTQWEQRRRPKDRLYHGTQLQEAREWTRRNEPSKQEAAFLLASQANVRERRIKIIGSYIMLALLFIALLTWIISYLHHPLPDPTVVTTLQDAGYGSLRDCIERTASGQTIHFAPNVQKGTIRLSSDLTFPGGKRLTIIGPGARSMAITNRTLSGKSTYATIHISEDANVSISGLRFEKSTTLYEAFIVNVGKLTLTNSDVSGNLVGLELNALHPFAAYGGGIYNVYSGELKIQSSVISNNVERSVYASTGGGINNAGKLQVVDSLIFGNRVYSTGDASGGGLSYGGGIYNNPKGKLLMNESTIVNNIAEGTSKAQGIGGGVFNGGRMSMTNSTISSNKALSQYNPSYGGGISNGVGADLSAINSTLSHNLAHSSTYAGFGGGFTQGGGGASTQLVFCTIAYNTADHNENLFNDSLKNDRLIIKNSIVAAKNAGNGPGISGWTSDGYNLFQNAGVGELHTTTDWQVTPADLRLSLVLNNNGGATQTLALGSGSVAIDTIPANACFFRFSNAFGLGETVMADQRGYPRLERAGHACNVGAY